MGAKYRILALAPFLRSVFGVQGSAQRPIASRDNLH